MTGKNVRWSSAFAAILILGLACFAQGQMEESWTVSENAGTTITFLQADEEGDIYDVEQGSSNYTINIFDRFGNVVASRTDPGTVTCFNVDQERGFVMFGVG